MIQLSLPGGWTAVEPRSVGVAPDRFVAIRDGGTGFRSNLVVDLDAAPAWVRDLAATRLAGLRATFPDAAIVAEETVGAADLAVEIGLEAPGAGALRQLVVLLPAMDASDSEQRVTFAFTLTAPAPLRHDDVAALRHVLDHLRVD